MRKPVLAALLLLSSCGLPDPAFAGCKVLGDETFKALDWGAAERFDGADATALMRGIVAESNLAGAPFDLQQFTVPEADSLYVLVRDGKAFIIRVIGHMLCGDDPIPADDFTGAKLRALPRNG